MGVLEIFLLIVGVVVIILSYIVPVKKEDITTATQEMIDSSIKNSIEEQIGAVKIKINDITDETVTYAVEKSERALERISNEKIMAVNEYSDTVLEDINRNHKEVMFLYDMLNDKHQNIKDTASVVEQTIKEVETTAKEVKEAVKDANTDQVMLEAVKPKITKKVSSKEEAAKVESIKKEIPGVDISFIVDQDETSIGTGKGNSNERILMLHKEGKSNVAIAKELGLGVGEVKLVIDLFENLQG